MLADAADIGGHRAEDANYWQLLGAKLLSVLLFAAAGTGRSMADVARWAQVARSTSGLIEVVTRLPCHSRMAGITSPWVLNEPGGPKASTEWHCSMAR